MKPKIFILVLLTFSIFHFTSSIASGTVRYVSKTGSSTPPYTSWETAADSIQKAINIAEFGDTIYVANGVYQESLLIEQTIHLIGSSMDSTVIDGSLPTSYWVIRFNFNNSSIKNFKINGPGLEVTGKTGVVVWYSSLDIQNCIIHLVQTAVSVTSSSPKLENLIIKNSRIAIFDQCPFDTCNGTYKSNLISAGFEGVTTYITHTIGGSQLYRNNIVIGENSSQRGLSFESQKRVVFKNNLISGFQHRNVTVLSHSDSVFLENNNSMNVQEASGFYISDGNKTVVRNNIIQNTNLGVSGGDVVSSDYNLFNNVNTPVNGGAYLNEGNIIADPMFVNDTLPTVNGSYDLHLQKHSPAIDAGDKNILDADGTRSDIGMYGGPLGETYTYMDLAPKPPRNLTGSLDSGLVHLKWNKNTEADLFRYRVYRDTVPDFIYDPTKLIATVADTFYYDDVPDRINSGNYYYKLTAIDTAVNQSAASEEVHITITGIPEAPPVVVEHYRLLQNYPNPFNPTTTIPYRLKEGGYVKVMVYDIKGELVRVLVNQYQSAGYYEVEFSPNNTERKQAEGYVEFETGYYGNVASGIYLYRIEVIGEGQIPVYSDMKKMLMIK